MKKIPDRSFKMGIATKKEGKFYVFDVGGLPVDIHRKIYSYIQEEVMLHTWIDRYNMDELIERICDKNYNGAGTEVIRNIYSLCDNFEATRLLWQHTIPKEIKNKSDRYCYDDRNTNYHKFAKDFGKAILIEYGKILQKNDQTKITNIYTVCSILIYMYNNVDLIFDKRRITKTNCNITTEM